MDELVKSQSPGPVVLFGSGETSPSGRKVFDFVLKGLPVPPHLVLLETPAGFELNSSQVIGRVADFIRHHLQNFQPQVTPIPARKRGTAFSPDDPQIVGPILEADLIFMGPGSPSYAVRQLQDSLAWQYVLARHRLGAALVLASAATVAISTYAIPVYEIYKVGEDPHWKEGLDLFGLYGIPLVFVPHWNNNDGGDELDTSRCFIGQPRFGEMMQMLPDDLTVIGIDEKTALAMDVGQGICRVIGLGGVTLIHTGHGHSFERAEQQEEALAELVAKRHAHVHHYRNGQTFPLSECCPFEMPHAGEGLWPEIWQRAVTEQKRMEAVRQIEPQASFAPPTEVLTLVEARQEVRARKDWAASDALRDQIAALGWKVLDTKEGPKLEKMV